MTPTFSTNQSQCASFLKSVVTLLPSFKRVTTARNLLIDSHYKHHITTNITKRTFRPHSIHNHSVKSIILKNYKLLQNDPETGTIFSQPPLISFKRDKNIGNFLVRSSFQTNDQPGTFKCARARCKTCPFIHNANKISGPKRSTKITGHFTCTSANVIYCITCTYCKKIYIGETGRRLGDRFREHLRDVERNDKDTSKPVARHFNLPNHSKQHMAICGLSLLTFR